MPWNSTIIDSQILAVHAALVPNGDEGEVVLFGGDEHWFAQQEPDGNFRKTRVYDVRSHSLVPVPIPSPDSDVFCAHHAFATDGRLLIAGGTQRWPESGDAHVHGLDFLGHRRCWLYNHKQRTWSEVTRLNTNPDQPDEPHSGGRWYPGLVTLANGEVAAFFGHLDQQDFRHRNTLPERYNQAGNFWVNMQKVMGTAGEPNEDGRRYLFFPRVYQLPNGQLFFATPMPANFSGSTEGEHLSTAYDPFTGNYQDPKISLSDSAYYDWNRPAVLLPLLPEVNPGFSDIPQRITFPFHVRFQTLNTYATFTDTRQLRVTFTLGHHTCSQTLDLTYAPNPYMIDINVAENNPAWLSTDVRVFSILEGQTKFGDIFQGAEPIQFIRQCLDKLNNPANNGNALFESLSTSATLDLATRFQVGPVGFPLFNYAIARVRYRATTTTAQRVKCFFRTNYSVAMGYVSSMAGGGVTPDHVDSTEIVSTCLLFEDKLRSAQTKQVAGESVLVQVFKLLQSNFIVSA